MTQEDKKLLLQDLSARLPYGVKIMFSHNGFRWDWEQTLNEISQCEDGEYAINGWGIHGIKPYLRPLSSMTSQEWCELCDCDTEDEKAAIYLKDGRRFVSHANRETFLNSHHFDYRGLIERGLAIEAPEGMYEIQD